MQVAETIAAARAIRATLRGSLGLVPTMGYLHEGHLSLVRLAAAQNEHVAVSIFVNPTQFGPNEDFTAYPRDMGRDLDLLRAEKVALVFAPAAAEMYPPDFQTYVEVLKVAQGLEGVRRPGHFRGVATVVAKLFNIIQPTRAYFGQKDAQQVAVIKRLTADLAFPLEIVVAPTVREPSGLAMSSRNTYLTPQQRAMSAAIYHALRLAKERYESGERSPAVLRGLVEGTLEIAPLLKIDYVGANDAETLEPLDHMNEPYFRPILLSVAVFVDKTRLIDNVILGGKG